MRMSLFERRMGCWSRDDVLTIRCFLTRWEGLFSDKMGGPVFGQGGRACFRKRWEGLFSEKVGGRQPSWEGLGLLGSVSRTSRGLTRWEGCLCRPWTSGACVLHHSPPWLGSSSRHRNGRRLGAGGSALAASFESPVGAAYSSGVCGCLKRA
jgi:hypothetical protein